MKTLKIGLACMIGALIGGTVALGAGLLWLGVIVGGLIGYLSYEFKEVIQAVKSTYAEISGWRPDTEYWKETGLRVTALLMFFLSTMLILAFMLIQGDYIITSGEKSTLSQVYAFTVIIILLETFVMCFLGICDNLFGETEEDWVTYIKVLNPISFYLFYFPRAIITNLPKAIIFTAKFTKIICTLIYSDERLLCGVCAAIGTAIGYFSVNVIIGMCVGGIFGAINYEVISKRILKLPASV